MKKLKLKKSIILLSITLCGCLPATMNNLSTGNSIFNDTKENPYKLWQEDLKRKHQNKIPFTDSVNIKLKSQKENKTFSVLSTKTTLDLNTIPTSKIVYKKEFKLNKKELDIKENITINDTSKRYILYIKKDISKNEIKKINVNINAFDWVKNDELEKNDNEIIKESLLLNNNNSLQIHLEGKENSKVTIALIEDDNSGTILKRNTLGNHKTNQDHINANDINIFDINDTNKFPFLSEEDKDITPKNADLFINNEEKPYRMMSGKLIVNFRDYQSVETFKTLYGATVEDVSTSNGNTYYTMKLDTNKIKVNNFDFLLKELNKNNLENITSLEFSSIAFLKTFYALLDCFFNHSNLINTIEPLMVMEPNVSSGLLPGQIKDYDPQRFPGATRDTQTLTSTPPEGVSATWWSDVTKKLDSWDYSIGTGVKAVINETWPSFKKDHPEIKDRDGRVTVTKNANPNPNNQKIYRKIDDVDQCRKDMEKSYQELDDKKIPTGRYIWTRACDPEKIKNFPYSEDDFWIGFRWHGHYVTNIGFGGRNNGYSSVGVSPNSNVSLYVQAEGTDNSKKEIINTDWITKGNSLDRARVFNISYGGRYPGKYIAVNASLGATIGITPFLFNTDFFTSLSDNGVSVVTSAGNDTQLAELYYPAVLGLYSDKIITVGGLNADHGISYDNFSDDEKNKKMLWAPGNYIYPAYHEKDVYNLMQLREGSSYSAPQVSGTISLMLSRNPLLTPKEIKDILLKTSGASPNKDPELFYPNKCMDPASRIKDGDLTSIRPPFTCPTPDSFIPRKPIIQPVKSINILEAVREAIRRRDIAVLGGSNNPDDFKAKDLPTVYFDRDKKKVIYPDGTEEAYLPSISDVESEPINQKLVNFRGWKPLSLKNNKEEFEVQTVLGVETNTPSIANYSISGDKKDFILSGTYLYSMPDKPKIVFTASKDNYQYIYDFAIHPTATINKEGKLVNFSSNLKEDLFKTRIPMLPDDFKISFRGFNGDSTENVLMRIDPTFLKSIFMDDGSYTYSLDLETNLDLDYVENKRVYFKAFGPDFDHSDVTPENCTGTQCKSPADEFYFDNLDLKYSKEDNKIKITGSTGGSLYKSGDPRGFKYNKDTDTSGSNYYKLCISGNNLQKTDFCSDIGFTIKKPFGTKSISAQNGENILIATQGSKTPVKIGDTIAIPLSRTLIDNLADTNVTIEGHELNFQTLVRNFALFRIPDDLKNNPEFAQAVKDNVVSILLKNKITGKTILTLEQAIAVILEETQINVNFNKLLYFTNTGYLNLIDTSGVTQNLFYGTIHNAIWNKTKTKIAAVALNPGIYNYGIYIYSLDPTGNQLLTGTDFIPFNDVQSLLKWSPKEDKILYLENGIWVLDLNTKVKTKLTNDGGNVFFNWSNDGNKIVFSSGRSGTGRYEIYTMNPDGSNLFQVTNNISNSSSSRASTPIFTKDGSRILYAYNDGFSYSSYSDIYSIKIDGTDNKRLTNIINTTPALVYDSYYYQDNDIKLSTDGTKVAFFVAGSTGQNLATMNVDGSNFKQITNLSGPHPRIFTWSTIEDKLAYGTTTNSSNTYYATSSIYLINSDGTNDTLLKNELGYISPQWGIKSTDNKPELLKSLNF